MSQVSSSKGLQPGSEALLLPKSLLPYNKRLPADRIAKLPNTTADSLTFTLNFNASGAHALPPGHSHLLGTFEVSGKSPHRSSTHKLTDAPASSALNLAASSASSNMHASGKPMQTARVRPALLVDYQASCCSACWMLACRHQGGAGQAQGERAHERTLSGRRERPHHSNKCRSSSRCHRGVHGQGARQLKGAARSRGRGKRHIG